MKLYYKGNESIKTVSSTILNRHFMPFLYESQDKNKNKSQVIQHVSFFNMKASNNNNDLLLKE